MKFFIPYAKDEAEAESVLNGIREFNKGGYPQTERRIFSIDYVHEDKHYKATVGQAEDRTKDEVLAIIETRGLYLVCTVNRGGLRGGPLLVGLNEVTHIEDFEGFEGEPPDR